AARGLGAVGLVLAAPAMWGGVARAFWPRSAAWLAAAVVPERRLSGRGVVRIQASDNIEALRALGRDPLYLAPPSARELLGLVRVVDQAAEAAPRVDLPALMLLGARDQIVPEAAVTRVFARLKGARETKRYAEGWHLLFRDLGAGAVIEDVAAWTLARPGPACK
ncbi:MAG: alpha/beta hydrolase, partial [Pseudomonadota bacterium]